MLETPAGVIHALMTYTDWWQPTTTSVMRFSGVRRRSGEYDGFREGLLDTLDERTEICRRMSLLSDRERRLLFLWYVVQSPVSEIARDLCVSARQCFRIRSRSIRTLVELGRPEEAA
jgi:DNA-directed RNA polymerase specialized sigma24 family protein